LRRRVSSAIALELVRRKLQERNYGKKRFRKHSGFSQPLALARGQRLQATSGKLQAPSSKLDKKVL